MKTFKQHLTEAKQLWYHGRNVKSPKFDIKYTGAGNDEDGPGFYFSTSKQIATGYSGAGGIVITAELRMTKLVKGKPNRDLAKRLIVNAPDYKDTLSNWSENTHEALRIAIDAMMEYSNTKLEMTEQIWYDFYRHEPAAFLKMMVELGFDGHIATRGTDVMVMYNPKAIKTITVENYEDI